MFRKIESDIPNYFGCSKSITKDTKLDEIAHSLIMVDQICSMEFSKKNNGFQRGAVSALAQIQTEQQAISVLRVLQQRPAQYNLTGDVSAKDAFNMVRPRFCQMPTELDQFAEHLAKGDMAKLDAAYEKALQGIVKTTPVPLSSDDGSKAE